MNFFNMPLVLGVVLTPWKTSIVVFAAVVDTEEDEGYDFVMDPFAWYLREAGLGA